MTFTLKFSCVGSKHTTEFLDFDPFSTKKEDLRELCYMLHRTYEAVDKIADYMELYDEVNENELEV